MPTSPAADRTRGSEQASKAPAGANAAANTGSMDTAGVPADLARNLMAGGTVGLLASAVGMVVVGMLRRRW